MIRHLIHIGYPKAGSTFLRDWFARHPQIAFQKGGIAGFGDVYAVVRAAANPDEGLRWRVTSCEGLAAPRGSAGEIVIDYSAMELAPEARQQQACALLARLFGAATILIVTRGFRSMILSSYSQYLRTGGDVPFEAFVEHALAGRGTGDDPLSLSEHWNYDRLIADYGRAFGTSKLLVMPYELLRDDSAAFLAELQSRLGVDPLTAASERFNPTLSPIEMAWYPRLTHLARRIRPRRLFGLYVRAAFNGRLGPAIRLLQRLRPLSPVGESQLPDELVAGFRGCAHSLRSNPLYAAYSKDYLF